VSLNANRAEHSEQDVAAPAFVPEPSFHTLFSRPDEPGRGTRKPLILITMSLEISDERVPLFGLPDSAYVNVPFHISQRIIKEVPPIPADENPELLKTDLQVAPDDCYGFLEPLFKIMFRT
tara:strand:- start:7894 stop:8256 length:363 start_codon:yes stop_codon:yes gene_type:complete